MEITIHQGRNVKRFREMLGIKQDVLAIDLGLSQQAISALEQKEALDADTLDKIAALLKVPAEAIKNFDEESVINIISNTFNEGSFLNTGHTSTFNINQLEKWLEALEENKRLYEARLKDKDDMIAILQQLVKK